MTRFVVALPTFCAVGSISLSWRTFPHISYAAIQGCYSSRLPANCFTFCRDFPANSPSLGMLVACRTYVRHQSLLPVCQISVESRDRCVVLQRGLCFLRGGRISPFFTDYHTAAQNHYRMASACAVNGIPLFLWDSSSRSVNPAVCFRGVD